MKKASIAIAVLLVISILATIFTGVALGSQGIKSLYNNSELRRMMSDTFLFSSIGGADEPTDIEVDENVNDYSNEPKEIIDSGTFNEPAVNENNLPLATRSLLIPTDNVKRYVINAEAGDVTVTSGKGKPYMKMSLHSADHNIEGRNGYIYEVAKSGDTVIITLKSTADKKEDNAMSTLFLMPKDLADVDLVINAKVGNVKIGDVNPDKIDLNLSVGNATLTNVISNVLDATLDIGNIVVSFGTRILEDINLNVKLGNVELYLPKDLGFTLDIDKAADIAGDIAKYFTEAVKTLVDGNVQYKDGKVKINVDIGGNFKIAPDESVN